MSTVIDIDSLYRDKFNYENPAEFEITASQVETWFSSNRTTRATAMNPASSPYEASTSIKLDRLIIPYTAQLALEPRLYVDFQSNRYKSIMVINAIDGKHPNAKFVLDFSHYQDNDAGDHIWIHYKSNNEQVMRFRHKDPIKFRVSDRYDNTLPLTTLDSPVGSAALPEAQVMATFVLTPYILDGTYNNQLIQPITMNQS